MKPLNTAFSAIVYAIAWTLLLIFTVFSVFVDFILAGTFLYIIAYIFTVLFPG